MSNVCVFVFLQGGCVDSVSQGLAALMMVLGQQDVSKVQTGQLTPYTYVLIQKK